MSNEPGSGENVQNDAGTSRQIDTRLTRVRSLDVLARALICIRPKLPATERDLASALAVQIVNYAGNPDVMRPNILRTIEQIEANRKAA